jgi:hypothetical protein
MLIHILVIFLSSFAFNHLVTLNFWEAFILMLLWLMSYQLYKSKQYFGPCKKVWLPNDKNNFVSSLTQFHYHKMFKCGLVFYFYMYVFRLREVLGNKLISFHHHLQAKCDFCQIWMHADCDKLKAKKLKVIPDYNCTQSTKKYM